MSYIYNKGSLTLSHALIADPKPSEYELHMHDFYEILCFVSGNARYIVEGHEYSLNSGCLMLMRPAELHKLMVLGKGTYERYVVTFRADDIRAMGLGDDFLKAFNDRSLGEKNKYSGNELFELNPISVFRKMCTECATLDPRQAILANLSSLLCSLNLAFLQKDSIGLDVAASDIGREMIAYINENLTDEISLASVSEHVHMSPSQVNRIFRQMTGTSVYDYILSKRLIMAQELIANGEGAVAASQSCGFADYSSFYRSYKKRIGHAPSKHI